MENGLATGKFYKIRKPNYFGERFFAYRNGGRSPVIRQRNQEKLHIKSKETLRKTYLNPALENGLIKMTLPDKPHSKNQKYFK